MTSPEFDEESLERLIQRFLACTLPKAEWTHAAHLAVALWHLNHFPPNQAMKQVRQGIKEHNICVGTGNSDSEGYHETITWFWMQVAEAFLMTRSHLALYDSCNELIRMTAGQPNYISQFYSPALLKTIKARREIIAPDLQSFDPRFN